MGDLVFFLHYTIGEYYQCAARHDALVDFVTKE